MELGSRMELGSKVLGGDILSAARLISEIENEGSEAVKEMDTIYPYTGNAYIVGLTGSAGAGKSTLANCLISAFRQRKLTVGVIVVDPTSPFTGGALLGDRIRMQGQSMDKDIFIRSLATRGWVGGLSKATLGTIHIMDAMGKDIILVETVGSGQTELDIVQVADTTVVILAPGAGDEIQMMKAGILEAADIFVVSKADKEGAEKLKVNLEVVLGMRTYLPDDWKPNIVLTSAISGQGIAELTEEIFGHKEFVISSGGLEKHRGKRAKLELIETLQNFLRNSIESIGDGYLEKVTNDLVQRKTTPHSAVLEITPHLIDYLRRL